MATLSNQHDTPLQTLFNFERHMIPWARTRTSTRWRLLLMIFAPIFLLCISYAYYVWRYMDEPDVQQSFSFLTGTVFLSLTAAPMLLDFAVLVTASASIGSDKVLYRWDLMRLALEPRDIVRAKYEALKLRPLRMLVINVVARAVLVGLIFIWLAWGGIYEAPGPTYLDVLQGLREDPTFTLTLIMVVICLFSLYIVEPLWRSRAMAALGLWISGYVQELLVAVAITTLAWSLYWISLIVVLVGYSGASLAVGIALDRASRLESAEALALAVVSYVIGFVLLNWLFPLMVQRLALWRLTKRVARSDY